MYLNIVGEDLLFLLTATLFLAIVGWAWRKAKPYQLPELLPSWFKIWFLSVQIGGGLIPFIVLLWVVWQGKDRAIVVLASYFVMLALQILSEIATLRWFHSVVWVMVPYLYLPYRIWQLYEGIFILAPDTNLVWVQNLLLVEIVLWTLNYALDLSQLPRLLRWEVAADEI
ncbi:hypothetical protein [Aliterella atlantica]|uniref:Uncharacterized protein n=1 Tax=Aliterella atlantica CENA595 TaxID=1618023 RepID=A0A0D8ZRQ2_9CYAN|nr:hypothetical protein UH38_12710 [Aliterella atlantica CENA595]